MIRSTGNRGDVVTAAAATTADAAGIAAGPARRPGAGDRT